MRVRLLLAAVVGIVFLSAPAPVAAATPDSSNRVELTLFYGEGCPYCAKARAFLVGLQERQPQLDVVAHEVWHNEANLRLFRETAAAFDIDDRLVRSRRVMH